MTATLAVIIVGPIQGSLTPIGLTALVVAALGAALIGGLKSIMVATVGGPGARRRADPAAFWSRRATGSTEPSFRRTGSATSCRCWSSSSCCSCGASGCRCAARSRRSASRCRPRRSRIRQHAVVWGSSSSMAAFAVRGQPARGPCSPARCRPALIAAIIMLSMVVLTGYVGQISLAQMSLAGVAAFFMARMMADGSATTTNPFPVDGPGLPWPIAALARHRRGRGGRRAPRPAGGAHPRRAVGRRHARVRHLDADAVPREPALTDLSAGVAGQREAPTVLRHRRRRDRQHGQQNDDRRSRSSLLVVLALCAVARGQPAPKRAWDAGSWPCGPTSVPRQRPGSTSPGPSCWPSRIAPAIAGIGGVMLAFKQNDVSSANFVYQSSLSCSPSPTSAASRRSTARSSPACWCRRVGDHRSSNYFFDGTNIDSYIGVIGGASLMVTAIVHPEGIAPFFQSMMRQPATGSSARSRVCDRSAATAGRAASWSRPVWPCWSSGSPSGPMVRSSSTTCTCGSCSAWRCRMSWCSSPQAVGTDRSQSGRRRPDVGTAEAVRSDGAGRLRARLAHLAAAGRQLQQVLDAAAGRRPGAVHPLDHPCRSACVAAGQHRRRPRDVTAGAHRASDTDVPVAEVV